MYATETPQSFSTLFRKFRLRSEIETLGEFTDIMSTLGEYYDQSLFSHWQNGSRTPRDRKLILTVADIFIKRGGITQESEINALLESAGQGNLTIAELSALPKNIKKAPPFMAPQLIGNLIRRDYIINRAKNIIFKHKILLLTGISGIGKTVTAIKLAHDLKNNFSDGVLWFRIEKNNTINILYSLGLIYNIKTLANLDKHSLSSLIRSSLSEKNLLYIFDNIDSSTEIDLLMPNSDNSAVIITSNEINEYPILKPSNTLRMDVFKLDESINVFSNYLGKEYVSRFRRQLEQISKALGNLPIAIQIASRQFAFKLYTPDNYLHMIENNPEGLKQILNDNSLFSMSLNAVLKKISQKELSLLSSTAIFKSSNFSVEVIAHINNLNIDDTKYLINKLVRYSLIEPVDGGLFKIHPMIRTYLEQKIDSKTLYHSASMYYIKFIRQHEANNTYQHIEYEFDGINETFKFLINNGLNDSADLYVYFGIYLWNTGRWELIENYSALILNHVQDWDNKGEIITILCNTISWYYYWSGDTKNSLKHVEKALKLAIEISDPYYTAVAKERLGKLYAGLGRYKESEHILIDAIKIYEKLGITDRLSNTYRYLGETYMLCNQNKKAKKVLFDSLKLDNMKNKWVSAHYKNEIKIIVLIDLAILQMSDGNYKTAARTLYESLSVQELLKNIMMKPWTYCLLGLIFEFTDDDIKARRYYRLAEDTLIIKNNLNNLLNNSPASVIIRPLLSRSLLIQKSEIKKILFIE